MCIRDRQKGVDALLLADMMDLALSKSVDLAYLVSGDEDLVEAVKRVQAAGIRLHLWGVDTPRNTVSGESFVVRRTVVGFSPPKS